MKTLAIIQARMAAKRLPGKVLADLYGQPMLARVYTRVKKAKTLSDIVVATSVNPQDDAIVDCCKEYGYEYFRGDEQDVLDRFYQTAVTFQGDVLVRITADCPLIDPGIIDECVNKFSSYSFKSDSPDIDYVSNLMPRTFPRGLDTEVINRETLKYEWETSKEWREHVTMNIRKHPRLYNIRNVTADRDYSYMRWTVDTPEDMEFARKIYGFFRDPGFSWREVILTLSTQPDWIVEDKQVDPV